MVDHRVSVSMRWADMDAYQHINNVGMIRLVEEARIRFFLAGQTGVGVSGLTVYVAHQEIDYVAPLLYSVEPLAIEVRVTRIGRTGFDVGYTIFAPDGTLTALAETSMALIDPATGTPAALPDTVRTALATNLGDPIPFRRRRQAG